MLEKFDLSKIIRYGYGGFLLTGIVGLFQPEILKKTIESTGSVVTPLIIFSIGACIYIMYRYVIGEFLLYPFTHFIHFLWDFFHKKNRSATSVTGYLAELGIKFGNRRQAYTEIRRSLLSENIKTRLDVAHSETHILYITVLELFVLSIHLQQSNEPFIIYLLISFVAFVSAICADIQQHQIECRIIKFELSKSELLPFLLSRGYRIQEPDTNGVNFLSIIDSTNDERGRNYSIPDSAFKFINNISDIHIAEILPQKVRGNHFHKNKKELILVYYKDSWALKWSHHDKNEDHEEFFSGDGVILVEISQNYAHSIENTGNSNLIICAMSNTRYSTNNPDTFSYKLVNTPLE